MGHRPAGAVKPGQGIIYLYISSFLSLFLFVCLSLFQ